MTNLTIEQIFTYIVAPIIAAGIGIWKIAIPAYIKMVDREEQAKIEEKRDNREYQQSTQVSALKQVLENNQTLTHTLIDNYNRINQSIIELGKTIDALQIVKTISDVRTQIEISNRDRVRLEEIVSDIDNELHEIKSALNILKNKEK